MEESPGDESRIKLAYSNAHYDNVGMVYRSYDLTKKCYDLLNKNDESSFYSALMQIEWVDADYASLN